MPLTPDQCKIIGLKAYIKGLKAKIRRLERQLWGPKPNNKVKAPPPYTPAADIDAQLTSLLQAQQQMGTGIFFSNNWEQQLEPTTWTSPTTGYTHIINNG